MRLSEAIRLGAMLRPQGFGDLWTSAGLRSCALGAALDAAGLHEHEHAKSQALLAIAAFPILDAAATCPSCARPALVNVGAVVVHLNDYHHWTREAIADWVARIEERAATTPNGTLAHDAVPESSCSSTRV